MSSKITWLVNGKTFESFDVFVTKSNGVLNQPKRKDVRSRSWAEMSGTQVNLSNYSTENREINLDCFLVAENYNILINKFNGFKANFAKKGFQRLVANLFGKDFLPYDVYLQNNIEINKTFRQKLSVATFKLSLIESNVDKDVYKCLTNEIDITLKINDPINISLGDASNTIVSVSDTSKELNFKFNVNEGDLVIISNASNIERINILNAVKIWEKI